MFTITKPLPAMECLSCEGAGVRGGAYAGAVLALDNYGVLDNLKRVAGSSAGAITAMLLGVGYTPVEIHEIVNSLNFKQFQDPVQDGWWSSLPIVSNIDRLMHLMGPKHGIYKGDVFFIWAIDRIVLKLESLIAKAELTEEQLKIVFGNSFTMDALDMYLARLTFREYEAIRALYGEKFPGDLTLKELTFTGSELESNSTTYFNARNTPDVCIAKAVRISMSVPFAFESVTLDEKEYVDGGTTDNDPRPFDKKCYVPAGYRLSSDGNNPAALGMRIETSDEIRGVLWKQGRRGITLGSYFAMAGSDTDKARSHPLQTLQIYDEGIHTLDFDLTEQQKYALINSGYQCAEDWVIQYRLGAKYGQLQYPTLRAMVDDIEAHETDGFTQVDLYIYLCGLLSSTSDARVSMSEVNSYLQRIEQNEVLCREIELATAAQSKQVAGYCNALTMRAIPRALEKLGIQADEKCDAALTRMLTNFERQPELAVRRSEDCLAMLHYYTLKIELVNMQLRAHELSVAAQAVKTHKSGRVHSGEADLVKMQLVRERESLISTKERLLEVAASMKKLPSFCAKQFLKRLRAYIQSSARQWEQPFLSSYTRMSILTSSGTKVTVPDQVVKQLDVINRALADGDGYQKAQAEVCQLGRQVGHGTFTHDNLKYATLFQSPSESEPAPIFAEVEQAIPSLGR